MAMLFHSSEELAEFSRSRNRSSGVRRRSPVNQAAIEQRKQRTRSQRIRSKARKSDRRDKWAEHHVWEVTEENPDTDNLRIPTLLESLVEVARFSSGRYQPVQYTIDGFRMRGHDGQEVPGRVCLYEDEWFSSEGGYFLVVNPVKRVAALQSYESTDGCESCDNGRVESDDGVNNELKSALKDAVPCGEMYRRAKSCVDPKMHLRRLRADDLDYDAVSAVYASYLLFHEQTLTPMARLPCTEWKCRRWSQRCVNAVVKFQALWRGWYFRHRVLFSPHTHMGRWFLQHQWNRLNDFPTSFQKSL